MIEDQYHIVLPLAAGLSALIVVLAFWAAFREPLTRSYLGLIEAYESHMVLRLQFPDRAHLVVGGYLLATVVLAMFFAMNGPLLVPVVLGGAYVLPRIVFTLQLDKRRKRIEDVLPGVLQQLSANAKNVGSISLALREVSRTAPEPMDYELSLIARQEQELVGFGRALHNARARVGSKLFDVMTSVLVVSEEKGGRASAALANLSRVFTQLQSMQHDIDTATSQGRMAMRMMLAMPFVIVTGVYLFDPDTVSLAVSNTAGKVVLGLAVFFYLLSLGLAIWLSKVKI